MQGLGWGGNVSCTSDITDVQEARACCSCVARSFATALSITGFASSRYPNGT